MMERKTAFFKDRYKFSKISELIFSMSKIKAKTKTTRLFHKKTKMK
jgi:hypothetical protein